LPILSLSVYNDDVSQSPLREPTFLILTALAEKPQHGYGIMVDVDHMSGGRVKLRPGTLYAALDRVVEEGLVQADREEIVDGRLRRYYRLTPPGRTRLTAEVERLRENAAVAAQRLRLGARMIGDPA
jgi:DNA-binding PadR family transcriptional regulator